MICFFFKQFFPSSHRYFLSLHKKRRKNLISSFFCDLKWKWLFEHWRDLLSELNYRRISRPSLCVKELCPIILKLSISKEIGKKVIFIFHNIGFLSHLSKKMSIIKIEIMTLCKIFERIWHPIARTKIFFLSNIFSNRLRISREAIIFKRWIINCKFRLTKFCEVWIFYFLRSLKWSKIDNMSKFMSKYSSIFRLFSHRVEIDCNSGSRSPSASLTLLWVDDKGFECWLDRDSKLFILVKKWKNRKVLCCIFKLV